VSGRRLLLLGGSGQIGWELRRTLAPLAEVIAPSRAECDLSELNGLKEFVRGVRPEVLVNAAAFTAVDDAESDVGAATKVNAEAPGVLAEEAARVGALLVHYSTDYVFDGSAAKPYREEDLTHPLNVYGATKLAGEEAIAAVGGRHVILRTSWVYGLRGRNFLRTVRRLAREREEVRIVNDQIGAPTWSRLIAEGTAQMLANADHVEPLPGVYHFAAGGETSWHGFASAILSGDPDRALHRCARVTPIPTADYPTPARRPRYSVLDSGRAARELGIRLPSWEIQLEMVLEELRNG
jgi:dTDP-4-dehydrorhamnose reductase